MSYCRFTSDSDVYAYECEGGVQFWVAGDASLDCLCGTFAEAYQYALRLREEHGVKVPDYAIDELMADMKHENVVKP